MADQRRGASNNGLSKATQARTSEQGQNPQPCVRCIGGLHGPRDTYPPERQRERRHDQDPSRTSDEGTRRAGTTAPQLGAARGAVQRWADQRPRAVKRFNEAKDSDGRPSEARPSRPWSVALAGYAP